MSALHELLPIASSAQTRTRLWQILRRRPMLLTGTVAVLLLAACCGLAVPAILGGMVNVVAGGSEAALLWWAALGLLGTGLAGAGLGILGQVMLAKICEGALVSLREEVFAAATRQSLARIERAGTGDVVARVSGDVEAVSEAISGVLPAFTTAAFTIAVTVVGLGVMDWRFMIAALLAAPLQIVSLRWFLRRTGPVYRDVRIAEANRTEQVLETVHGAHTVMALQQGPAHADLLATASREAIALHLTGVNLLTRFFNRLNLAELIGLAAILATGFWLVTTDGLSLGAATAAALYFYRLFDPIGLVLGEFDELQKAGAGLSRMVGLTQLGNAAPASQRTDAAAGATRPASLPPGPAIDVDGLTFSYPGQLPAVRGISLSVKAGERVALVGASGAGKTSVAKLLMGLQQPDSGTIRVAGRDTACATAEELRSLITLVSQDVHVFSGSLAADLRLAAPDASDADLLTALDRVGAAWVQELADGLDTSVGAGGYELSAEQAQQVALARLILRDAPIVILDEATAEAGTGSARLLDQAATAALAGRTGIVIAHRLSQAVSADRVVVMAAGRIVESGPHQDLVDAGGPYAELWSAWSGSTA